jgi:hypothetical protein
MKSQHHIPTSYPNIISQYEIQNKIEPPNPYTPHTTSTPSHPKTTMYVKHTYEQLRILHPSIIPFTVGQTELSCTPSGNVFRKMKTGFWKEIENKNNHSKGYNVILIEKKQYTRAKLMLYAHDQISLKDKNVNIYHINNDRLDCTIDNLTTTY